MDITQRLQALKLKQVKLEAQLAADIIKEEQIAGQALAVLIQRSPRVFEATNQSGFLSQFPIGKRKTLEKWLARNTPAPISNPKEVTPSANHLDSEQGASTSDAAFETE